MKIGENGRKSQISEDPVWKRFLFISVDMLKIFREIPTGKMFVFKGSCLAVLKI